jgi:hypothetical protein
MEALGYMALAKEMWRHVRAFIAQEFRRFAETMREVPPLIWLSSRALGRRSFN